MPRLVGSRLLRWLVTGYPQLGRGFRGWMGDSRMAAGIFFRREGVSIGGIHVVSVG